VDPCSIPVLGTILCNNASIIKNNLKMELTKKAVKAAAKEFNEVVILEPQIVNPKESDQEKLEKQLYDAMEYIEEGDVFSDETDSVFNE